MDLNNDIVLRRLGEVIKDAFGISDIEITRETVASDIPGWDSLSHTVLICCIEQHFGISIDAKKKFRNLGVLADEIAPLIHE